MSAILKPAMRRAWPRQKLPGALYHDFVRDEHAVNGVRDDLENIWTYTNGDTPRWGWVRGSDGKPVLKKFAAGEARRNIIDPATGRFIGYLAEGQAANELLDNRDPSQWSSQFAEASVSLNETGIDGKANKAATITDSDTNDLATRTQDFSVPDDSNPSTVSAFIKADDDESRFPALQLVFWGGTTITGAVQINTKTGEIVLRDDADSVSVKKVVRSDGIWWRSTVTVSNNSTGNTNLRLRLYPAFGASLGSTDTSATGSIVYDFGQVELNSSFATSPIETGASAVTRAADDASEPLPSALADGFVWVVECRAPSTNVDNKRIGEINENFHDNRLTFFFNGGDVRVVVDEDDVTLVGTSLASGFSEGDRVKIAGAFENGNYRFSVDGGSVISDTTAGFPNNLSNKDIGFESNFGAILDSTIALDKMYDNPADWSDADLKEASS